MTVKLGKQYTDKYSGITGTAVSICEHLTGCTQVCLEVPDKDKTSVNELWFDITRMKNVKLKKEEHRRGGPAPTPPSRNS